MPEKILRKLPDPQPMPMTVTDALRSRRTIRTISDRPAFRRRARKPPLGRSRRDDKGRKENRTFLPQPPERLGLSSREGRRLAL